MIESNSKLEIVIFSWFAYSHISPYMQLANKLAERGCKITFLLPQKALGQIQQQNHHPGSITLHPLIIPAVEGLPQGAEMASDIPMHMTGLLCTALDRTRPQFEEIIRQTKPNLVMHDIAHWIPEVTEPLGIKVVNYNLISAGTIACSSVLEDYNNDGSITEKELATPPEGYPSTTIVLRPHEARTFLHLLQSGGENISFYERVSMCSKRCEAISLRTCYEVEGELCDYVGTRYKRPVILSGPVLPEPSNTPLEEKWDKWLSKFEQGSVVFCAFGSQQSTEISKEQFQELCLGFESTGLPFLVALSPPRVWESLMSDCQIVMLPHIIDQVLNARLMAAELKVGVEVERDENGWFSKENVCISIKKVMDKDDEFASTLRNNHAKLKDMLTAPGFMSGYIDRFVQRLEELVK
ncbi:hypothetical protein ACFE04_004719 [Oxalis oulophora]